MEMQKDYESRGIDWDLEGCISYNTFPFTLDDIEKVLAVVEGENDEKDWNWVIQLKDTCVIAMERNEYYAFIMGGCDYTGWDCQSWGTWELSTTPWGAAKYALGDVQIKDKSPFESGMGHMLQMLSGTYGDNLHENYEDLLRQLTDGKNKTWYEKKDEEFGTDSLPKI